MNKFESRDAIVEPFVNKTRFCCGLELEKLRGSVGSSNRRSEAAGAQAAAAGNACGGCGGGGDGDGDGSDYD